MQPPPERWAVRLSPGLSSLKSSLLDLQHANAKCVLLIIKLKGTLRIKLSFLIEMDFLMPFL